MTDIVEQLRAIATDAPGWPDRGFLLAAAAEIERLRKVRDIADLLVNECEGGIRPPSLGILARLEDALAMEHKARRALEPKP